MSKQDRRNQPRTTEDLKADRAVDRFREAVLEANATSVPAPDNEEKMLEMLKFLQVWLWGKSSLSDAETVILGKLNECIEEVTNGKNQRP